MVNDTQYTYYAFVSHSHRDAKWADWIWKALERYRLPSNVRKIVPHLPKKVQPVFLDKADLGSGKLVDGLYKELKASRYLIVLCSPDSAKPNADGEHYVETEVRHFIDLGRSDRIIPVIVSGTYPAVYCPALKNLNPKGIDAVTTPRARVLNDVVAAILGLRPDELWQRERRRQRIRLFWRSILGAAALFVLGVVGLFVWEDNRKVEINYADYVEAYGLPQGLFKLTDEEVSHRHVHYRFEYRGLKYWPKSVHEDTSGNNPFRWLGFKRVLRRVDQANSAGIPISVNDTELGDRPQIQIFDVDNYDSNGKLKEKRHATFAGEGIEPKLVKRIALGDDAGVVNAIASFSGKSQLDLVYTKSVILDGVDNESEAKVSEITKHVVTRDEHGHVLTVAFYNATGKRVCDAEGVGGFRFVRDGYGRIVKCIYLDMTGKESAIKNGTASRVYEYEGCVMKSATYVGTDGSPIRNAQGWARCVDTFDQWQNVDRAIFYGENGEPGLCSGGFAECRANFDEHGNLTRICVYGVDGKPCITKDGFWGRIAEYDAKGQVTRNVWIDVDGKPCFHSDGYAECRLTYDARGNITSMRFYGVDGKPCFHKDRIAGWDSEYDENGWEKQRAFIGVDGKPCLNECGIAEFRGTYDAHGNVTSLRYYGVDGKLSIHKNGIAGLNLEYDEKGQQIRHAYIGVDEKPCLNGDGIAEERLTYDPRGNITATRYYGVDGKPCLCKYGFAGWNADYDEKGQKTHTIWVGTDEKPCLNGDGIAEERLTYDPRGNITATRYYGVDGKPCLCKNGFAGWNADYDEKGQKTHTTWVGTDEKPCLNHEGVAEERLSYDAYGNVTLKKCYGTDGKLRLNLDGYAACHLFYDAHGNITTVICCGIDGKQLCLNRYGHAGVTCEYDENSRLICRITHGADGNACLDEKGVAVTSMTYDARGNQTSIRYYGVDGRPCCCKDGFAGWNDTFDEHDRVVRRDFCGIDGKPCLGKDGHAQCHSKYDNRGNMISARSCGVDGKLCQNRYGSAGWDAEYDEKAQKIRHVWIGIDEKPCLIKKGYAEGRCTYDPYGNIKETRYYDADGTGLQALSTFMCADVIPKYPALTAGVLQGDFVCLFGGDGGEYSIDGGDEFWDVAHKLAQQEKHLILARKVDGRYEIKAYDFSAGPIGIRFDNSELIGADAKNLLRAYKDFNRKE